MTKLLIGTNPDGSKDYIFHCPACGNGHGFRVGGDKQPAWQFNGDMDNPTFTPSLRCLKKGEEGQMQTTCHLNITGGMIVFHGDCPHVYAGKTVPMEDMDPPAQSTVADSTDAPEAPAPPTLPQTPPPARHSQDGDGMSAAMAAGMTPR